MTTLEKIKQLSDNDVLSLYQGFSGYLIHLTGVDLLEVIRNPPEALSSDQTLAFIKHTNPQKLGSVVHPPEVIPMVRAQMEQWSQDPELAVVLEEYMESNQISTMAAGTILAIGGVLVSTIVASSLKIERVNGKTSISYNPEGSKDTVELVKTLVSIIPDSIKKIFMEHKT